MRTIKELNEACFRTDFSETFKVTAAEFDLIMNDSPDRDYDDRPRPPVTYKSKKNIWKEGLFSFSFDRSETKKYDHQDPTYLRKLEAWEKAQTLPMCFRYHGKKIEVVD